VKRQRRKPAKARKPAPKKKRATPAQDRLMAYIEEQRDIAAIRVSFVIYKMALRDLLAFWDRREESGWHAADVKRLEEIRKLCAS
jgi:hypothetical protein